MKPAVRVENLSKRYRVNLMGGAGDLRETLADLVKAPLHRLRHGASHALRTEDFWALRDVHFEVKPGEVLGVIGRNGAGKSTLLKILSGITEPTSGRAEIRGRVGSLLEVGTGFHPDLTGRENMYLNASILGMSRREVNAKFDEIVAFAGVEKFLDTPVKRYSSGMRVRLGFAVAAHLEPEILIIDEVLAVGDVGFQKKCLGKMDTVAQGGRTVLFVSHNMGAVKSLCHRSVWLEGGTVRAVGKTDEVVGEYLQLAEEARSFRESQAGDPGFGEDYRIEGRSNGGGLQIDCGDPLVIEFTLKAPKVLDTLSVGLTFITADGIRLLSMSSKVQQVVPNQGQSPVWKVKADLGKIPFNAGRYSVTMYIGDGVRDVARFSGAFSIEVIEHDVFGWGNKLPTAQHWGPMYWTPDWVLTPV